MPDDQPIHEGQVLIGALFGDHLLLLTATWSACGSGAFGWAASMAE